MVRRSGGDSERARIVIDQAAAAEVPGDADVREWAHSQRGFISSVMSEFAGERSAAAEALRTVGVRPVMFEEFGGRDADPEAAYLAEVGASDIYIGILGRRYGKSLRSRFSATHAEYRHAETSGLRICVWALDTDQREGPEQSFLEEVRVLHVANTFQSPDDLRRQVERRMREIAAEELSPWCKLGRVIFRATKVADTGVEIQIDARVRSDEVAHALEEMRGDQWGHGFEGLLTWQGRSKSVVVRKVEAITSAAMSKVIRLQCAVAEGRRDPMLDVSYGRVTPEKLTEIGLRVALLGERNPLKDQQLGFAAEMSNPFEPLAGRAVPEESIRPIANLLVTETLVGSFRASRIVRFALGVPVGGKRRMLLSWLPTKRFSKDDPPEHEIVGDIDLS